jgi:rod shape determining protein RodA
MKFQRINWALVTVTASLLMIGAVNLYSALGMWGEEGTTRLAWLQLVWIGIGALFTLVLSFSDYRILERLAYMFYIVSVVLVAASLFTGHTVYGHKSWLGFGGFGVQPSEFAKLAVILVLARFFANNPNPQGFGFTELAKPAVVSLIPTGLVILQKDLGSALFFVLIFVSFAWFAKVQRRVALLVVIAGILACAFGYHYVLSDYQKARITTFLNPACDVKGSGYHIAQSRIAVGSGRFWGKGYLKGNVNKLKYLPEKHTDFVFPVLAEEWGLAGCAATLVLYYALLSMIIELGRTARERFGTFLAVGIGAYFFWQIAINLGGVLGLMPLTGVTLPFLSYGGSSTITVLIAIGLLLSISRKRFVF